MTSSTLPNILKTQFDLLGDAPNGILKLRELILQLAVQGRLVEQDPAEESVKGILMEIGKLRGRDLEDVVKMQTEIPATWSWIRLHDAFETLPINEKKIRSSEIQEKGKFKVIDQGKEYISGYSDKEEALVRLSRPVVVFGDHTREIKYVDFPFVPGADGIKVFDPYPLDARYFYWVLKSLPVPDRGYSRHYRYLLENLFPICPKMEQHRIVAKVDQLMALCDELETRQKKKTELRISVSNSALDKLTQSQTAAELVDNWKRVSSNFNELYAVPETVSKLRQTILQLAVQGRLVEQDAGEVPASQFVTRVQERREILISGRQIRRQDPLAAIDSAQVPFELPKGWAWARFGDLVFNRDGERIPIERSARSSRRGIFDYYGASGVIDKIDDYLFDKPLLLIGEDGANLLNRTTPIAFIAEGKYWVNNHAHVLDGLTWDFLRYLEVYVNAIDLQPYVTGTAQPKMNQAKMNSIIVAVPPESEQQRIVTRVNQLLKSCDDLERMLEDAQALNTKWVEAVVRGAVGGMTISKDR